MIDHPRKFFYDHNVEAAKTHVAELLSIKSGVLDGRGGMLIDGRLSGCQIRSSDDSPICISALAVLDDRTIDGKDVLIEGQFSGTINARGKVEFASGCVATGIFNKGGEVYVHPLADLDDLRIKSMAREAAAGADSGDGRRSLQAVNA